MSSPELESAFIRVAREMAIAEERFVERELVEILRQVIASGDVVLHRWPWNNWPAERPHEVSVSEQVVYTPGLGVEKLRQENVELRKRIEQIRAIIGDGE